jgi:U6 snRNA-associated Sm-like protein LSm7
MSERGQHSGRGGRGGGRGNSEHRGGRGGGGGPRGGGHGGHGGQQGQDRPKKENILDLGKYMDKRITVKFNGGREGNFDSHRKIIGDLGSDKRGCGDIV